MAQRTNWTFPYKAEDVAAAATAKVQFHTGRIAFWQEKLDEVKARIRETGLDIKESVAGAFYDNKSAMFGAQVTVDRTMQRDLDECFNKITEHREKVKGYTTFAEALTGKDGQVLELDADDIEYFWGK